MSGTPAARRLADWAISVDDLAAEVLHDARLRFLDTIGVMLIATSEPLAHAAREAGMALAPGSEAGLVGFGGRTSVAAAALVNGTLAHATDFDDTHRPTLVHPSGPVVAAALAVGEKTGASGRAILAAIAIGNEVACRLGNVAPMAFHGQGMHPTAILGPFAAALVAARLMNLDAIASTHALGIAGSQASGILESFADGSWVKPLHSGWAAQAGISAAYLAAAGFTGPATVFEGRFGLFRSHLPRQDETFEFRQITDQLGSIWAFSDNAFKLYPCAHVIHPFLDLALALREEGLEPNDIERIELPIAARYLDVIAEPRETKVRPRTPTHARASLPYCVASALLHGRLNPGSFTTAAIADPEATALAERMHPVADPETPPPHGFQGRLRVTLKTGDAFERATVSSDVSEEALLEKFHANTRSVIGDSTARGLAEAILALDKEPDLNRILTLCRPAE